MRVGCLLVSAALIQAGSRSEAAEYAYYPAFLRLGAGVDSKSPLEPFPYCFTFTKTPIEGTAISSRFSTSVITTRRDMLNELGISASISGRYQFFGGGASASYDESYRFSSDSLSWAVRVTTDYGRQEIESEQLKPPFDKMIAASPAEFAVRCGTELITQERRSATVAAIFTLSHITEEKQRQLTAAFNAGVTTGAWDAKAEASFRSFVAEAARSSALSLDVVAIGGGGASALSSLITDYGDLGKVTAVLQRYAEGLNFNTAAPTSFLSTSMKRYGWNGQTTDLSSVDLSFADYYIRYKDAEALRTRVNEVLDRDSSLPVSRIQPGRKGDLAAVGKSAEALLYRIIDQANKCRSDTKACLPVSNFTLPEVKWPNTETLRTATNIRNDVSCTPSGMDLLVGSTELNYICQQRSTLALVLLPSAVKMVSVLNTSGTVINFSMGSDTSLKDWSMASSGASTETERARIARSASELASEQLTFSELDASQLVVRSVDVVVPFGSAVSSPHPLPLTLKVQVNSGLVDSAERDVSIQ